ncbi:MAG: hypothetical protein FWF29_08780 [Treponema sp.]|nr:hypothetical protein [Treponema sp.]
MAGIQFDMHLKQKTALFGVLAVMVILSIVIVILILQIQNRAILHEQLAAFQNTVAESFTRQTEQLFENESAVMDRIINEIDMEISAMETNLASKITNSTQTAMMQFRDTNNRIQALDAIYSGLLAEQKKRTLDSIYTEAALAEIEQAADRLFRTGNYARASVEYEAVARQRPKNTDARFYSLYSLFLSNKLDRSKYRQITEGLETLQRNGYQRVEINEVLDFITLEKNALHGNAGGIQ